MDRVFLAMHDPDWLDDALRNLSDPGPCPRRMARLQARLRARRRPVARPQAAPWRCVASLAAGLLLILLVGLGDLGQTSIHALPKLSAQRSPLPSPLPRSGRQSLDQALARHAVLAHPGLRGWWVRELRLSRVARTRLLRAAIQARPGAQGLALEWWQAHPEWAPLDGLVRAARTEASAGRLGVALAGRLSGRRVDRLLQGLARESRPGSGALRALVARQGMDATVVLAGLLYRQPRRAAAARELDRLGPAVIGRLAALIARTRTPAPILDYLGRSRHPQATRVLIAALQHGVSPEHTLPALGARGEVAAVRALSRWQDHPVHGEAALEALVRCDAGVAELGRIVRAAPLAHARRALDVLGSVSSERTARSLAQGLRRPQLLRKTIALLARHGSPVAMQALARFAADARYRKRVYAELAESGQDHAKTLLAREVSRPERACAALRIVVAQQDVRLLPTLGRVLTHPRYARRALDTIAGLSDARALGYLIQALSIPRLRQAAHRHLVRRTGQQLPRDPGAWTRWYRKAAGLSL